MDYVVRLDYTHETASDDDFQLLYFDRHIAYVWSFTCDIKYDDLYHDISRHISDVVISGSNFGYPINMFSVIYAVNYINTIISSCCVKDLCNT